MREQFDYREYPLDRQQIWIELWHKDFERTFTLRPIWRDTPRSTLPRYPGWIRTSFWKTGTFRKASLAIAPPVTIRILASRLCSGSKAPELRYNISIKRHLLSALISRMIVPIVILIQLFVIVVVIGTKQQAAGAIRRAPGRGHFHLRGILLCHPCGAQLATRRLEAYGLVYLESLYILTYFVILAVAINSVLLVAQPNLKLFRDYDNLWAEVFYWPTKFIPAKAGWESTVEKPRASIENHRTGTAPSGGGRDVRRTPLRVSYVSKSEGRLALDNRILLVRAGSLPPGKNVRSQVRINDPVLCLAAHFFRDSDGQKDKNTFGLGRSLRQPT